VDRTIQICSLTLGLALAFAPLGAARASEEPDMALFWQAQRAELSGQPAQALKSYDRLLGKLPQSSVAVDRLFDTAILHGDFAAALKAARAQQLADSGEAGLPLLFYVDAWKRKDWAKAELASAELRTGQVFGFLAPLLNSWIELGRGRQAVLSNATLRENGTLAYYSDDQLVYLDLANGNLDRAKRRLTSFPGFGADYARHLALSAVEQLGANGEAEFANALLDHVGLEPRKVFGKPTRFAPEQAMAALFSRLAQQLEEQGVSDQALYFARLAQWASPDSPFARMTLAQQLSNRKMTPQAMALLEGVAETRPQWSWAIGDKARLLDGIEALAVIRAARNKQPDAVGLKLLEAQHLSEGKDLAGAAAIYRTLVGKADASAGADGRRVTFRLLLGQSLEVQGDWPAAKAVLEEALTINDQNPQLLNSLGYGLLERRENVKRGLELVSKAYRLAPQSPAITDSLAWGHYLNGDYEKAIPLLEKAVEEAISDVTINEHLGDAYWQVGRRTEARYAWRAAALQASKVEAERLATKIDIGWTEATAAP
jgi:tetratricopeptide (TPR) repeat protein